MKVNIKNILVASLIAVLGLVGVMSLGGDVALALNPGNAVQRGITESGGSPGSQRGLGATIQIVVEILLFILGAIAVVMIVIGGIKYTTSNGDASAITSAKNTILYSIIGLVLALMAYAIVNFVVKEF